MFQERLNGLAILLIDKEMLEEFEKKKKIKNMSRNYLIRNSLSSDATNIHNNYKLVYYLTHRLLKKKNYKLYIVTPLCVK